MENVMLWSLGTETQREGRNRDTSDATDSAGELEASVSCLRGHRFRTQCFTAFKLPLNKSFLPPLGPSSVHCGLRRYGKLRIRDWAPAVYTTTWSHSSGA